MAREEEPYPFPSYPGFGMYTEPFATQVTQVCVPTSQSAYARDSYCYIVTLYRKEDSLLHKSIWYLKKKSPIQGRSYEFWALNWSLKKWWTTCWFLTIIIIVIIIILYIIIITCFDACGKPWVSFVFAPTKKKCIEDSMYSGTVLNTLFICLYHTVKNLTN